MDEAIKKPETQPIPAKKPDVTGKAGNWFYTDVVKDHFFNPRNFMHGEPSEFAWNGRGQVGSPACGDMMYMWLNVDTDAETKTEKIVDLRWKTFGCGSAIASTSMMSDMIVRNGGMSVDQARKLKPQDIMAELGGLPTRKFHCSVLADKALRDAINDYYYRSNQKDKVQVESARMVDAVAKVTDHDIEEAVLDGADTFEKVQARTKVGTGDPSCIPAAEELVRFYKEKYFG